jgi:non-ribosomal peptide synthetase component F/acyl carrier protein
MQQIEQEVREFVIDSFLLEESDGHISDDDSFIEQGLVNSLDILSLVTFVQKKYSISVQEEELITDNWDSVQRIAKFIRTKLKMSSQDASSKINSSMGVL